MIIMTIKDAWIVADEVAVLSFFPYFNIRAHFYTSLWDVVRPAGAGRDPARPGIASASLRRKDGVHRASTNCPPDVHQLSTVCPFSRMERSDIIILVKNSVSEKSGALFLCQKSKGGEEHGREKRES